MKMLKSSLAQIPDRTRKQLVSREEQNGQKIYTLWLGCLRGKIQMHELRQNYHYAFC
jgi:hypothetical protein